MSPALEAAVVWLLGFACLVLLAILVRRRNRGRVLTVSNRSERQEAILAMLTEWLDEPRILEALLRSGRVSRNGLDAQRERMPIMTEAELMAMTAALLQDRNVRRVVAAHMVTRYRVSKEQAIRDLAGMMEVGR